MTLTFKDPNGVEWRLLAWSLDDESRRDATTADLLAALGQLSTGSGGPTDAKRLRELAAVGFFDTLQADISTPLDDAEADGLRTVWNDGHWHGRCLGEQEQAARVAELEAKDVRSQLTIGLERGKRQNAESKLAATKAKFAEESGKRDESAQWLERSWLEHTKRLRSELASARRAVEAATLLADTWGPSVAANELREALTSAGTDADRTEAPGLRDSPASGKVEP